MTDPKMKTFEDYKKEIKKQNERLPNGYVFSCALEAMLNDLAKQIEELKNNPK